MNTKFTIYWTVYGLSGSDVTYDLIEALKIMERLRKDSKYSAIAMSSESTDQVGKMGVDSIVDGVLPDGQDYVYMKRREE